MQRETEILRDEPSRAAPTIGGGLSHTPGPWHLWEARDARPHYVAAEGWTIAEVEHYGYDLQKYPDVEATQLANARLIAAAPDLLEALKALEPFIDATVSDDCYAACSLAKAALSKAGAA